MKNDNEFIENLFVLNFLASEYRCSLEVNDFNYGYMINLDNFKIIKSLLIVENEKTDYILRVDYAHVDFVNYIEV